MKIAVGRAFEDAYGFAFKRFFSVLGTVWLPYVVLLIAFGLFFGRFFMNFAPIWLHALHGGMLHPYHPDPDEVRRLVFGGTSLFAFLPLLVLFALFVRSMVYVGLLELALGMRKGPVIAYWSFGAPVWRLFGASILAFVILWVIAAVIGGTCAAIWFAVANVAQAGLIRAIAVIVAIGLFFYSLPRLFFFLAPVVVAEGHMGFGRSWQLGSGNVLRMIVTVLGVFIPAFFVFAIVSGAVRFATLAPALSQMDDNTTPQQMWQIMTHQGLAYIVVAIVLQVIYSVIIFGLAAGLMASAYRSVAPADNATLAATTGSPA